MWKRWENTFENRTCLMGDIISLHASFFIAYSSSKLEQTSEVKNSSEIKVQEVTIFCNKLMLCII